MTNEEQFAYPFVEYVNSRYHVQNGLTKRELFAAMAMQGMVAHYGTTSGSVLVPACKECVAHADALLAALKDVTP
jgi:hypothetical protein